MYMTNTITLLRLRFGISKYLTNNWYKTR